MAREPERLGPYRTPADMADEAGRADAHCLSFAHPPLFARARRARPADRALLLAATVTARPALVAALVIGDERDATSAQIGAAVVHELARPWREPAASLDAASAMLREALVAAHERVQAEMGGRAPAGRAALGSSVVVALVLADGGLVVHVGDVRARVARGDDVRQLVAPHALAYDATFRKHLGDGAPPSRIDVLRFPLVRGDCLWLGGPGLDDAPVSGAPRSTSVVTVNVSVELE